MTGRTRQALVPLPQNRVSASSSSSTSSSSNSASTASGQAGNKRTGFASSSSSSASASASAPKTRRALLRNRLAQASSAILRSPQLLQQAACFVDLDHVVASPDMRTSRIRAGLKRKKGSSATTTTTSTTSTYKNHSNHIINSSISNNNTTNNSSSSSSSDGKRNSTARADAAAIGMVSSHAFPTIAQRRSASSRNASAPVNIVTSPHVARDTRPSSSASEQSDWSSLASVSPTTSRTLPSQHGSALVEPRPGPSTRRSSRNSLYTSMHGMTLEDRSPPRKSASTSSSHLDLVPQGRKGSRTASRDSREMLVTNRPVTRRTASASAGASAGLGIGVFVESDHSIVDDDHHGADELGDSENDEDEDKHESHLIDSAPTWRLHKLRKEELVQLNLSAGTWDIEPDAAELEVLTKQDLVNRIIDARSLLDHHSRRASPSQSRDGESVDVQQEPEAAVLSRDFHALGSGRPARTASRKYGAIGRSRHASQTSQTSFTSQASSTRGAAERRPDNNHEHGDDGAYSDVSNEGGGEETEAEQARAAIATHRTRTTRANRKQPAVLRRMDSSTFDAVEPVKQPLQPPRRQLRDRASLFGTAAAAARRLRRTNASEPMSASSSSIFGGRSSRASNASQSTYLQRHQINHFVASSPIRTRSRTRINLGIPTRRRSAAARASARLESPIPDELEDADSDGAHQQSEQGEERHSDQSVDPMATPKLTHRSLRRRAARVKAVGFLSNGHRQHGHHAPEDEDEWMEDLSTDSETVAIALGGKDGRRGSRSASHSSFANQSDSDSDSQADSDSEANEHESQGRNGSRRVSRSKSRRAASQQYRKSPTPLGSVYVEIPAESDETEVAMATASDDEHQSPLKFRRLRNGKVRMTMQSRTDDGNDAAAPASDVEMQTAGVDDEEDQADVTIRVANSSDDDDEAIDDDDNDNGVDNKFNPDDGLEETMQQPSATSLARLRKPELEALCGSREIRVDPDDKKADLIAKLLKWHDRQNVPPSSNLTNLSDLSVMSTATATSGNTADGKEEIATATATATAKAARSTSADIVTPRATRALGGRRRSANTDSDQPLLLQARRRGGRASDDKLPTPPLTSNNDEAQAPQAGDGVDELNGLDLESLNLVDKEIAPSKLEKLEKIGSGGFKDVYVGKYHISKSRVSKVAIADIRNHLTEMDIKELSLLRDLRHENIVRFIGVSIPENPRHVPCMIVSELCSNGDLFDYIRNTEAPCDAEVFRILLETARGLEYLHTRTPAIIHRDCKSTNVLITRRRTAKINDFGLARVKNTSRSMMRSLVGTVNWQAVELWSPKPQYNEKVDVWSAGMTFWETLQWHQPEKKYPFQGMNEHQIYQDVGQKKLRPSTVAIRRRFGAEIVELLDRMWDHSPKNRPSMTQVCDDLEELIRMKKAAARASKA